MIKAFVRARRLFAALLLTPLIAWAAIVTAQDIINAILASPYASPYLRAHAAEIAALAINVESGGNTEAYNGSCCYGVLQLNTTNINAAGMSTQQYLNASLQTQINAWANVQSTALNYAGIQPLYGMATFDGQPVDAAFMLACVQLGQGNCTRMLQSGTCNGFADSNGTTICSMATRLRAGMAGATSSPTASPTSPGLNPGGGSMMPAIPSGLTPAQGFAAGAGSGVTASSMNGAIRLVAAALILVFAAWAVLGHWVQFVSGQLHLSDVQINIVRMLVVVSLVLVLLN